MKFVFIMESISLSESFLLYFLYSLSIFEKSGFLLRVTIFLDWSSDVSVKLQLLRFEKSIFSEVAAIRFRSLKLKENISGSSVASYNISARDCSIARFSVNITLSSIDFIFAASVVLSVSAGVFPLSIFPHMRRSFSSSVLLARLKYACRYSSGRYE